MGEILSVLCNLFVYKPLLFLSAVCARAQSSHVPLHVPSSFSKFHYIWHLLHYTNQWSSTNLAWKGLIDVGRLIRTYRNRQVHFMIYWRLSTRHELRVSLSSQGACYLLFVSICLLSYWTRFTVRCVLHNSSQRTSSAPLEWAPSTIHLSLLSLQWHVMFSVTIQWHYCNMEIFCSVFVFLKSWLECKS
jgi:hypothetical protein